MSKSSGNLLAVVAPPVGEPAMSFFLARTVTSHATSDCNLSRQFNGRWLQSIRRTASIRHDNARAAWVMRHQRFVIVRPQMEMVEWGRGRCSTQAAKWVVAAWGALRGRDTKQSAGQRSACQFKHCNLLQRTVDRLLTFV